jgi:hypothetical protein
VMLSTMLIVTVIAFVLAAAQNRFYLEPPPPPPPPPFTATPTPIPATPTPTLTPTTVVSKSTPIVSTPTPTPDCSGNDQVVKKSLPKQWQAEIESECAKLNRDTPKGLQTATAVLGPIEVVFKSCTASVTIRYACQIAVNKKEQSLLPGKPKTFRCNKERGHWICIPN